MKMLKQKNSVDFKELEDAIIHQFSLAAVSQEGPISYPNGLVINLEKNDIMKNIEELEDREFLKIDEDLSLYEYIAD